MIYAKDEVYDIKYDEKKNILELKERIKKEKVDKIFRKVYSKFKEHKFIACVIASLIIFSTINIVMIYEFIELLQKV